jgi:hypothetical protein
MNRVDRDALRRALALVRAESPGRAVQIATKLKDEPWEQVAEFASYCCQIDNLELRPWQDPPLYAELRPDQPNALALLVKLLGAGLSRYEPDPAAALAQVRGSPPCRQTYV